MSTETSSRVIHTRRQLLRSLLVVLAMVAALVVPVTSANGASGLTAEDSANMRAWFADYGVTAAAQSYLTSKVGRGELLDSDRNVPPVRTEATRTGQVIRTVRTYPDGSISVSEVSDLKSIAKAKSNGGLSPRSVSSCVYTSGGTYGKYWDNCIAREDTATLRLAFRFNYRADSAGTRITSACCEESQAYGGSFTEGRLTALNSQTRRYSGTFVYYSGIASLTRWMQVRVSGVSAWIEHN